MSNAARNRAKDHFPAVLLTLLSIVQAIALELLWGHLVTSSYLYELTAMAVLGWTQVLATLLGMILIWVVYASNVMRFRWVPAVTDSIYPFGVGIFEFWLVECLTPGLEGVWLIVMGMVVAFMTWISQITMRRSRFDEDNADFFSGVPPATWLDFIPQAVVFGIFVVVGVAVAVFSPSYEYLIAAIGLTLMFLCWQFFSTTRYWKLSMAPPVTSV